MRWLKNHWMEIASLMSISGIAYMAGSAPETFGFHICKVDVWSLTCFGACMFFTGILCAWVAMEIIFHVFNRFVDIGHFEEAFEEMSPREQVLLVTAVFIILAILFVYCCAVLT